jgi:hypothetical protein
MAATDITALVVRTPAPYEMQSLDKQEVFKIGVLETAFSGIETVATHSLITVPEGHALVSLDIIPTIAVTSAGDATVQFACGGVALHTAIGKAELVEGRVIHLPALTDGTSVNYSYDSDNLVDIEMIVGTAALTAGEFVIRATYHDMKSTLERG